MTMRTDLPRGLRAVLFDRDGTLVFDDPDARVAAGVRPIPGAPSAVARLRASGFNVGVVTNQPGVGLGTLDQRDLDAMHDEIDRRIGPFDVWAVCPHVPAVACACRKPMPGLVLGAARRLGCRPRSCVVVGDIGSDIDAAARAGAAGILVPTRVTRPEEIARAPIVATTLAAAVDAILGARG